jgi:hypothetical protein
MRTIKKQYIIVLLVTCLVTLYFGSSAHALNETVAPSGDIQGAINAVIAAGGGTVTITSGTASIATVLTMGSNVSVVGAGNPNTTLDLASGATGGFTNPSGAWSWITVKDIKVQGAGTSYSQDGFGIAGGALSGNNSANNVETLSDVQALNCGYDACVFACNDGSVTSCDFHNSGMNDLNHGCYFSGGNSVIISGCTMSNSPYGSGLHVNNWCNISGGESENNITSNNGQRGHSFTTSTSDIYDNFTINNCRADNNGATATDGGYGFSLLAGSGTIENCTATGNVGANYELDGLWTSTNNH